MFGITSDFMSEAAIRFPKCCAGVGHVLVTPPSGFRMDAHSAAGSTLATRTTIKARPSPVGAFMRSDGCVETGHRGEGVA